MSNLTPLLLLAALLAFAGPIHAETRSFRCKNDLLNLGDNKASALLKCGEPLVKDSFCKPAAALTPVEAATGSKAATVTIVTPAACETIDAWTYNPGHGQFLTTLRFESGQLTDITYGDRVK